MAEFNFSQSIKLPSKFFKFHERAVKHSLFQCVFSQNSLVCFLVYGNMLFCTNVQLITSKQGNFLSGVTKNSAVSQMSWHWTFPGHIHQIPFPIFYTSYSKIWSHSCLTEASYLVKNTNKQAADSFFLTHDYEREPPKNSLSSPSLFLARTGCQGIRECVRHVHIFGVILCG